MHGCELHCLDHLLMTLPFFTFHIFSDSRCSVAETLL